MSPVAAVDSLQDQLDSLASDPTIDPTERVSKLRVLRADISSLLGQADRYINDQENQRESGAFARVREFITARGEANARGNLIDNGEVSPEAFDAAGVLSNNELDRRLADGTIEEAIIGLPRAPWEEGKHPRGIGGKFAGVGKAVTPKERGGAKDSSGSRELEGRIQDAVSAAADEAPRAPEPKPEPNADPLAEIDRLGLNEWPKPGPVAKGILGDAPDTQQLHRAKGQASPGTGGAVYSAARKPVHDRIVGQALAGPAGELLGAQHPVTAKLQAGGALTDAEKGTLRDAAAAARNGGRPVALFMGGGSASGKSSALHQAPELVPHAAVHIDPDAFKEQLPEYQQMVNGGERFAAAGVHEESSDLAKRAQQEARDLGLNMLIDGTGDSKPGKFVSKLQDADKAGYDVHATYVTVPTDMAVQRSVSRAERTGRFVPVPEVRNQHRNVSANFPDVAAQPFMKDVRVFDTSGNAPVLVASGSAGQVTPHDDAMYKAFLDKAGEQHEEATSG